MNSALEAVKRFVSKNKEWLVPILTFIVAAIIDHFTTWTDAAKKLWKFDSDDFLYGVLGTLMWVLIVIAVIYFVVKVTKFFVITLGFDMFHLRIFFAKRSTAIAFRRHIGSAFGESMPRDRKKRIAWESLGTAMVKAYGEELTALRHRGVNDRHLLLSNFQIYARCVTALLDVVPNVKSCTHAEVWTLLRRPIPDWYNLIPCCDLDANGDGAGVCTLPWWEDYKQAMTNLKDIRTAKTKVRRLIACPNFTFEPSPGVGVRPVAEWAVCNEGALDIDKASEVQKRATDIDIDPKVRVALDAVSAANLPDGALIHLLGTKNHTGVGFPGGWKSLLEHFHSVFHTGDGDHDDEADPDLGGVFYKYLEQLPKKLVKYDDVFIIEATIKDVKVLFGLALIVDEGLDVTGIRVLKEEESRAFLEEFQTSWGCAKAQFQTMAKSAA